MALLDDLKKFGKGFINTSLRVNPVTAPFMFGRDIPEVRNIQNRVLPAVAGAAIGGPIGGTTGALVGSGVAAGTTLGLEGLDAITRTRTPPPAPPPAGDDPNLRTLTNRGRISRGAEGVVPIPGGNRTDARRPNLTPRTLGGIKEEALADTAIPVPERGLTSAEDRARDAFARIEQDALRRARAAGQELGTRFGSQLAQRGIDGPITEGLVASNQRKLTQGALGQIAEQQFNLELGILQMNEQRLERDRQAGFTERQLAMQESQLELQRQQLRAQTLANNAALLTFAAGDPDIRDLLKDAFGTIISGGRSVAQLLGLFDGGGAGNADAILPTSTGQPASSTDPLAPIEFPPV